MRGREKFRKFRSIIYLGVRIINILPKKFRLKLFKVIRNWDSVYALTLRYMLLKTLAKNCGDNVSVHSHVYILKIENLIIGDNVSIHPFCYIDAGGGIEIKNDVSIAHGVTIMSSTHNYADLDMPIKDQGMSYRSTIINENVWVGAKATILLGTNIPKGVIVGANSLVNKQINEDDIVGGIPARRLKNRVG